MKKLLIQCVLVGIGLASSGAGCGSQNSDPQPAATTKLPTTLNEFDAYMIGTWDFQSSVLTFKKGGQVNSTFKSADYSYNYVFNKDHTFFAAVTIVGPTGKNIISADGKWATSTTAGSKPPGSFAYPTKNGPSSSTKPALPFSFVLTPKVTNAGIATNNQVCYILYFDSSDNTIAFDWVSGDGSSETWEIWQKIK